MEIRCEVCRQPINISQEELDQLEQSGGYISCPYPPVPGHVPHIAYSATSDLNKPCLQLMKQINSMILELGARKYIVITKGTSPFQKQEMSEFLHTIRTNVNSIINANTAENLEAALIKMEGLNHEVQPNHQPTKNA